VADEKINADKRLWPRLEPLPGLRSV